MLNFLSALILRLLSYGHLLNVSEAALHVSFNYL